MRFSVPLFRSGLALLAAALCLGLAIPAPLRAEENVLDLFSQAEKALNDAKEQFSQPAAQAALVKTAFDTLRKLPPSTRYDGHRGLALEALMRIVPMTQMNSRRPPNAPVPPPFLQMVGNGIDTALAEIALATTAWNGSTTAETARRKEPNASAAPPTPEESEMLHSVVIITGDESEGTGFLVKTADGPVVFTNLHVIFNNPNLKILASGGAEIPMVSVKGAADRDLAMISIKDDGYKYLELASNAGKDAQIGDALVTPGNSQGAGVILPTRGKLLAVGNQKVEMDNPVYHGNSGGPIYDAKIGKVIGVVTRVDRVSTRSDVDKNSLKSENSAIKGAFRYFGFRIDTVPSWESYDWQRFLAESKTVDQFHERSLAIDSYLNGRNKERTYPGPDYYMNDDQVRLAHLAYRSQVDHSPAKNAAAHSRALEQLVTKLKNLAETQLDGLSQGHYYAYTTEQAKDEVSYRKALIEELDQLPDSFDHD